MVIYVQRRKIEFFFARSSAARKDMKKRPIQPPKACEARFQDISQVGNEGRGGEGNLFPQRPFLCVLDGTPPRDRALCDFPGSRRQRRRDDSQQHVRCQEESLYVRRLQEQEELEVKTRKKNV